MTPNQDQYLMLVRAIMLIVGPLLIAHGTVNQDDWATLSTAAQALTGTALTVGPIIWGMFSHRQTSVVASTVAMPGTSVSPDGKVITLVRPDLIAAAKANATDVTGEKKAA